MDDIIFILHHVTSGAASSVQLETWPPETIIKRVVVVAREIASDLRYGENDYFVDKELYCMIV
jgi:hypothetical protein